MLQQLFKIWQNYLLKALKDLCNQILFGVKNRILAHFLKFFFQKS